MTAHTPYRPSAPAERQAVERLVADLPDAGAIPRKEGELAFDAVWEIRALGMAVKLHQDGHFAWSEFQAQLVRAIQEWERAPVFERGEWSYYRHVVRALERLVEERRLVGAEEIEQRAEEFLRGQRDPRHR